MLCITKEISRCGSKLKEKRRERDKFLKPSFNYKQRYSVFLLLGDVLIAVAVCL